MRVLVRCPKLMDALAAGLSRCKCEWMLYGLLTVRYSKHISNCEKKKKNAQFSSFWLFVAQQKPCSEHARFKSCFCWKQVSQSHKAGLRLRNSWDFFLDCGCCFLSFYLHVASWREQRDSRRPTSCCCVTQRRQQQQQQARTGLKKKKQQNSFLQKGQKKMSSRCCFIIMNIIWNFWKQLEQKPPGSKEKLTCAKVDGNQPRASLGAGLPAQPGWSCAGQESFLRSFHSEGFFIFLLGRHLYEKFIKPADSRGNYESR